MKDLSLRNKLKKNKLTLGSWITLSHSSIAEIMSKLDFDWLTLDMEHSAITLSDAQKLIQTIELSGVTPLVRVGENNPNLIKRVMDAGAHGVIVPMINNRDDAILAVSAVKYPPFGARGVGLARAQGYGFGFEEYKEWVKKESIVIVQIEHKSAIDNLEEILNVEGVDASIVGPYDLSASFGYPGEYERKEVKSAIRKYLTVCDELGKPAGFHVVPPDIEKVKERIKQGFNFIGFSLDTFFLGQKIREEFRKGKIKR